MFIAWPTPLLLALNGALLVASIILALIMLQAGLQWGLHSGNPPVQARFRRTVLITLVMLIFIGLAASILNLIVIEPVA